MGFGLNVIFYYGISLFVFFFPCAEETWHTRKEIKGVLILSVVQIIIIIPMYKKHGDMCLFENLLKGLNIFNLERIIFLSETYYI